MIAYALNPNLENVDHAYPFLISQLVPIGMRGIVFAALIGAIMSTIDSLVNSTSSLLTMDLYKKFIAKTASDKSLVKFAQIIGFFILVFGAAWTPMVELFPSIFSYVQECWTLMMAPCMAVFILAIFWKKATNTAAVATLFLAIPMLILVFIRQVCGLLAEVNVFNLGGIVFIISLVFMIVVSLYTRPVEAERLSATIWKPQMLKLPEAELKRRYPWWKRIGFWFAVVVGCFVVIYIKFW